MACRVLDGEGLYSLREVNLDVVILTAVDRRSTMPVAVPVCRNVTVHEVCTLVGTFFGVGSVNPDGIHKAEVIVVAVLRGVRIIFERACVYVVRSFIELLELKIAAQLLNLCGEGLDGLVGNSDYVPCGGACVGLPTYHVVATGLVEPLVVAVGNRRGTDAEGTCRRGAVNELVGHRGLCGRCHSCGSSHGTCIAAAHEVAEIETFLSLHKLEDEGGILQRPLFGRSRHVERCAVEGVA